MVDLEGPVAAKAIAGSVAASASGVRPGRALRSALEWLDARRLLVAVAFLGVFSFSLARTTDIDLWWHLKTGELIARSGAIPATDPFSFTAQGRPWVVHEWLWELAAYAAVQVGGFRLAALASALIVTLTYAILYRLLRRLGTNEIVATLLVLWAAALALPSIGVRPREVTHLLLIYFVSRLLLYRAGQVRRLWGLPIAMALWANVHGPFVLGLVVLGAFAAEALAGWALRRREAPRHLLLVALATVGATLLNPYGPRLLLYPLSYYLAGENPSFRVVSEFASPDFHQPLYLLFAGSLLAFALLGARPGRLRLADALLLTGFTLQALVSVRHVAVYALVAAPLLAARLADRFPRAGELGAPRRSLRIGLANAVILLALLGYGVWFAAQPAIAGRLQLGAEPNADGLPVAGARFIAEHDLPGPVFNYQPWGGYLLYRWYPERRVFIDGRVDMYGPEIVRDYVEVVSLRPGWREVLDRYGVRTVVVPRDSALATLLLADGGWERVFAGEVEAVFVRREQR